MQFLEMTHDLRARLDYRIVFRSGEEIVEGGDPVMAFAVVVPDDFEKAERRLGLQSGLLR
jgi:hypothetical protein